MPLQTSRLQLHPLDDTDRDFYCRLYTDAAVMAHVGSPLSQDAAETAFGRVLRQLAALPPRACYWILHARVTGEPLGLMALVRDRNDSASAEVGVLLLPDAQGRSHATAAIAALADHVFSKPGLQRLWARHAPGHAAALGLMRRLGFVPETGVAADMPTMVRWQLLREDWQPAKSHSTL
jgi:ribosomal-protein-alanine N-acetyltransferase